MKDVSVIIVNYNTADLVKACVGSALCQRDVNAEVIVVDNASADKSVDVLQHFGDDITLIKNQENIGFGKANNQAFRLSHGRYLFLLNPDAIFLTENDLRHAINYMDNNTDYGVVGTRILDSKSQHVVAISEHYPRQKQTSTDFSALPGSWATVLGASMVVRRDIFEKVGGFDEDFFLYAEETDLCLRIRQQGYKIGYNDQVSVQHVGGASASKIDPSQIVRMKKRAKYLFYQKHYPRGDVIKIAKKDLCHAKWHCLRLLLKKKILRLSSVDERQLLRHQVTCDVTNEVLQLL